MRIPGSSSPTSLVIVGAHFDSTGRGVNERGPGAIDNASGTVVLLESLRILAAAKYTPQNTLEFHFYAGEEGGMLGSKEVFESYKADKKNVLAMVNTDMAGYSPSGKISIYTDYVDPALTDYVRLVAEAYTGPTTADRCRSSACSDHNSARNNGFRESSNLSIRCERGGKGLTRMIQQRRLMCAMSITTLRTGCMMRVM